jgi:septal ring factor EnvC (AmiA/AmiB activator)
MKKALKLFAAAAFLALMFTVAGCSSGPSDDELAQLEALKAEVASLQKEVDAKQAEKASLQKQIADKQAELAAAQKEQDATRERLKSQQ